MKQEDIRQAVQEIANYEYGKSTTALFTVDRLINDSFGDSQVRAWIEQELVQVLGSEASLAAKQEICRRLWRIGTDESLPALEKLLMVDDLHLVEAACYAIGRRPSGRADKALKATLKNASESVRPAIRSLIEQRG